MKVLFYFLFRFVKNKTADINLLAYSNCVADKSSIDRKWI